MTVLPDEEPDVNKTVAVQGHASKNRNSKSDNLANLIDQIDFDAGKNQHAPHSDSNSLSKSKLGQIMNKIGLKIGENTGSNLNKLILQKPEATA